MSRPAVYLRSVVTALLDGDQLRPVAERRDRLRGFTSDVTRAALVRLPLAAALVLRALAARLGPP